MAGISRLDYRRFLVFNVLGALAWVSETAIVGYLVGKSYKAAEHRLSLISLVILALILLFFSYRYVRRSAAVQDWTRRRFGCAYRLNRRLVATCAVATFELILFAGVTQDVTEHDGVATADSRILHDVTAYRDSALTHLAKVVTMFGTSPVAYAVVVVAGVAAVGGSRTRYRWWPLVLAAGMLVSGQLIRLVINRAVSRPRPPHDLWLMHAGGYAFPSGHTTTAALAYVLAAGLLVQRWPNRRAVLFSCAGLCSVAVGLSRVYLGVHWPTDVLGGWLLAASWLALCAVVHQAIRLLSDRRRSFSLT
jgi:undecaprenyl-diphosphatase